MIDTAYDVLGLEAVFLVPRIFSLLSLNPYFGTLVCTTRSGESWRLAVWRTSGYGPCWFCLAVLCMQLSAARLRQRLDPTLT